MRIVVYGYDYCPYTRGAAELAGVPIVEARVLLECAADDVALVAMREEVRAAGHRTIPICFDMDRRVARFVGGFDALRPYMEAKARAAARGTKKPVAKARAKKKPAAAAAAKKKKPAAAAAAKKKKRV